MSDLRTFTLARIAEDEAVARAAIPGTYSPNADEDGSWRMIEVDHEGIWPEPASKPTSEWGHLADEPWALHVERHDPARVLAECEAKRSIVRRHRQYAHTGFCACCVDDYPCADLRTLGAIYDQHPDYREEWRP